MSNQLHKGFARAQAMLQQGQSAECAQLLKSLLKQVPAEPNLLLLLAVAEAHRGSSKKSEKAFLQASKAAPGRGDIALSYAHFLRDQRRIADAEKQFRKAIKLLPRPSRAWHSLGMLLMRKPDLSGALNCATQMTALATKDPGAWELKAAVLQRQGRIQDAISACREGLAHCPDSPRLHFSLAQLLRANADFDEAAELFRKADNLGFKHPDLFRNLAEVLLDSGDAEGALLASSESVKRFPNHAEVHRSSARLRAELQAPGDPVGPLREAAVAQPQNPALAQTLVELLKRLDREQEARDVLRQVRAQGCPDTPGILALEAMEAAQQISGAEGTRRFEETMNRFPNDTSATINFATHLLTVNEPERAAELCQSILRANPYDQLALAYRGTALELMGDPAARWLLDYERMVRPTPVPIPNGYRDSEEFFAEIAGVLEEFHLKGSHPIEQSVRGGTQTNGYLFRLKHPLLQVLEQQMRLAVCDAIASFELDEEHPFWGRKPAVQTPDTFGFAGAWSVRLRGLGYHTNHIHPKGWISSALYIALPDEVKDSSDQSGFIKFGVPLEALKIDLPPQRIVQPQVGSLTLFPSYMWHGTIPFESQQPRMTVAFDVLPGR